MNYEVLNLLNASLASSTRASYRNALGHYITFHGSYYPNSVLLPASVEQVAQFITICYLKNLKCSTITSYMSAIAYVHKVSGLVNPTESFIDKKLLHATRRHSSIDKRHAFYIKDIDNIVKALPDIGTDPYLLIMYTAMILTAFFGLLRVGEITVSTHGHQNIIRKDAIKLGYQGNHVSTINIYMSSYKHSQGHPASIPLCRQLLKSICPVRALIRYLKSSSCPSGHLFHHKSGQTVSSSEFREVLRSCVSACGLDPSCYTCHSLRIGGATHAYLMNMPSSQICKLGRWKSTAYKKYIRTHALPINSFIGQS